MSISTALLAFASLPFVLFLIGSFILLIESGPIETGKDDSC